MNTCKYCPSISNLKEDVEMAKLNQCKNCYERRKINKLLGIVNTFCVSCKSDKNILEMYKTGQCLNCRRDYNKEYQELYKAIPENKEKAKLYMDVYTNVPENKMKKKEYDRVRLIENIDAFKIYNRQYYLDNKEKLNKQSREIYLKNRGTQEYKDKINAYAKYRSDTDPSFKMISCVSSMVGADLKRMGSSKNKESSWKYIEYTPKDLVEHIEKQFECWMNWKNHGRYFIDDWNDEDTSTWKWQVDHIISRSKFKYSSMKDLAFQKCWSLSNLRPYSAKQNLKDSARKFEISPIHNMDIYNFSDDDVKEIENDFFDEIENELKEYFMNKGNE